MVFDRSGFLVWNEQSRTTQFIKKQILVALPRFRNELKRGDKLTALPLGGLTPATIVPRVFRPKGFPLLYLNHVLQ